MTSSVLEKLEDNQVIKFTDHKRTWSLSEDMVQQIDKVSTDQASIRAAG